MTVQKPAAKKRAAVTVAASPSTAASGKANSAAKTVAEPAAPTAKPRHKLVRDSFTIPKPEYVVLESLKLRAAKLGRPAKKSEMLRAGVVALHTMSDKAFLVALGAVPSIKTGRPKGTPKAQVAPK